MLTSGITERFTGYPLYVASGDSFHHAAFKKDWNLVARKEDYIPMISSLLKNELYAIAAIDYYVGARRY